MRGKLLARAGTLLAAAVVALVAFAAPASAHTISGPRPSNYRTTIVKMNPAVAGISVRVVDLGAKMELTNRTARDVTVLGYVGEPYLRVGPDGVYENIHSQATYLNKTRLGGTVPPNVDTNPTTPPQWKKVSDGHTARWHDHRVHWMSTQPPPQVAAAPGAFSHLSTQEIVMIHDPGQRIVVTVALDWVPGPSGLPWIPVMVAFFVLGFFAALLPRWRVALAWLIGLLVVVDMAHAIAYEIARPGTNIAKFVQFLGGSFVSIFVWIVAGFTIVGVLRRRAEAVYGVIFVGLLVALVGGATDLSSLWKSQLENAGPHALTRAEVSIALGLGAGLVAGALIRLLRSARTQREQADTTQGLWLSLLVTGLDDEDLERIAYDLDADDVIGVALRDLARRAEPAAPVLAAGALVFEVAADTPAGLQTHVWSLGAPGGTVGAARGRTDDAAAELRTTFPVLLQLLAGTVALRDASAAGTVTVDGDPATIAAVEPHLPEHADLRERRPV